MPVSLSKGGNVSLTKQVEEDAIKAGATPAEAASQAAALANVMIGLGWDVSAEGSAEFDLDASVVATDSGDKAVADGFVYYKNLTAFGDAIKHNGDNLTGKGEGDDETVDVNLPGIPANVASLYFVVSIHEAEARQQSFAKVSNAFIHIADKATGNEIARYDLAKDGGNNDAMIFGKLYRDGGEWKFQAVGDGRTGGLQGIVDKYGVA